MNQIQERLDDVLARIHHAAERAGRAADAVTLVAVSKGKPIEDIIAAYEAGVRNFGENRSEEFANKAAALAHLTDLHWHFIGHLQSRQSKPIAEYAHSFHAVDRIKIAQRLSRDLEAAGRTLQIFVEINITGEESKGGFDCAEWENRPEQFDGLVAAVSSIAELPRLEPVGLMTMAPFGAPETSLRRAFGRLRKLSEGLAKAVPGVDVSRLSMGMSGDFEIAVEEGATHVRVGTAIFGS